MDYLAGNVRDAAAYISKNLCPEAEIGIVLGSGLGSVVSALDPQAELPYEDISHFPISGVAGHAGKLHLCRPFGRHVLVLQGRFHYYEGYTMRGVTFPIRVLAQLGVGRMILTNAAGGLNRDFQPGDFMLVNDHINLMGDNPLIGVSDEACGPRFVDLRQAYSKRRRDEAATAGIKLGLRVREGVLAAVSGPSYETLAEAGFLARIGADAVTMSTVPETIVARQCGLEVLAVSCITNMLWQERALDHKEVVDFGERVSAQLAGWLRDIVGKN